MILVRLNLDGQKFTLAISNVGTFFIVICAIVHYWRVIVSTFHFIARILCLGLRVSSVAAADPVYARTYPKLMLPGHGLNFKQGYTYNSGEIYTLLSAAMFIYPPAIFFYLINSIHVNVVKKAQNTFKNDTCAWKDKCTCAALQEYHIYVHFHAEVYTELSLYTSQHPSAMF